MSKSVGKAATARKWPVNSHSIHRDPPDSSQVSSQPKLQIIQKISSKGFVFHTPDYYYGLYLSSKGSIDSKAAASLDLILKRCAAVARRKGFPCTITPEEVRDELLP